MLAGLNVPLSALRASLEALATDFKDEDPRASTLSFALDEVSKVGRAVEDLADYSAPPTPMPLRCTVEEIVHGARRHLSKQDRKRVIVARIGPEETLVIDGPLFARTLCRLLSNAVESGTGTVLVYVRREGEDTLFTTVNRDVHAELDLEWAQSPFHTDKPHHLGLGLALARRDIALMGGSLVLTRTPRGEAVVMARVPTVGADLG